jgi:hypothetical protein
MTRALGGSPVPPRSWAVWAGVKWWLGYPVGSLDPQTLEVYRT